MKNTFSLGRIAGVCAAHPWKVVSAWTAIFVISSIIAAVGLSDVMSNQFRLTTDFDSVVGLRELEESSLSESVAVQETIVIRSLDGTTVDSPEFREHADNVTSAVRIVQGEWDGTGPSAPPDLVDLANDSIEGSYVLNYYELQNAFANSQVRAIAESTGATEQVDALVSARGTILLLPVEINADSYSIADYIAAVEQFDDARFDVTTIGNLSINEEYQRVVAEELVTAEKFGLPIAIVVLLIVFGSLVAPVVPLVLGVMSVGIALGITTVIGQFGELQLFIQNMITMLGLAIGIDYSLFLVERFREQRARGHSKQRSIEIAGATAGKAVVFSGITVILAMLGVMFVRINIFFSLSLGAIIVVSMSVLLTTTLVPAVLSLVGDGIDWPRRRALGQVEITAANMYDGFWGRVTKVVVDRPWLSLISATLVLLVLASPVLRMETGFSRQGQLPPGEITEAYETLESDFSAGLLSPVYVVFAGERSPASESAVAEYTEAMDASGDFVMVSEPRWSDDGSVAEVQATLGFEGSSDRAYATIDFLRHEVAPATVGEIPGFEVYLSGQSAGEWDMINHLDGRNLVVIGFVLALSFVLLLMAFRSIVVPLKAIVFNLLSVGAAWGIMVAVFSFGYGRGLLGYNESPIIEMWLPILMFCVLFGLSMDYHVFIVSRIREHYDISHDNHESVAVGLRSTGKIITGAAAIMVVVFGAFSMGSMLSIQQLGFGLAVAIALDATIIRSVLVPSVMTLAGNWNWYLPKWLEWLPDLRIEGEPAESQQPADPT